MIERLRVRTLAEAAGEFSSPELTLCADSYSVSVPPRVTAVARKRLRSFCQKCRWQGTPKHSAMKKATTMIFKGAPREETSRDPVCRTGIEHRPQRCFSRLMVDRFCCCCCCFKSTFESVENTAVSEAIFCMAVRVDDAINNAGMYGSSVHYVMSRSVSALHS